MNKVIQGLWWPKLSAMEQLSIRSFLAQGHEYHLYAYGDVEGVPTGAVVQDANEIMPYVEYEHMAQFADTFRYKLLHERGGWWADLDVIATKPFDFDQEYVFSSEAQNSHQPALPNNAIIKAPAGAPIMAWMSDYCATTKPAVYTSYGPLLMAQAIPRFHLEQYVAPPTTFCPVPWWTTDKFLDGLKFSPTPHAYHLWNAMWRRAKRPSNVFSGLYGELHAKYGRGEGRVVVALVTSSALRFRARAKLCLERWGNLLPDNYDVKVCTGEALGCPDSYEGLAQKTQAIAKYAYDHGYDHLLKIDDDTVLHPERLTIPDADYAGWATDGNTHCPTPHCQGGAYWLSRRAIEIVANAKLVGAPPEDRWVGATLYAQGITPVHLDNYVIHPIATWQNQWRSEVILPTAWTIALLQAQPGDFKVQVNGSTQREKAFTDIYNKNSWGCTESRSGPGSSLAETGYIREALPATMRRLDVHSLLDAPCGDFNWAQHLEVDKYIGVDCVEEIIKHNLIQYAAPSRTFLRADIVTDPLPKADMVLCRDCLAHLPLADCIAAIQNFARSGSTYFVATTSPTVKVNRNIQAGSWAPRNLQLPPFNFPPPLELIDEHSPEKQDCDKNLGVWGFDSLKLTIPRLKVDELRVLVAITSCHGHANKELRHAQRATWLPSLTCDYRYFLGGDPCDEPDVVVLDCKDDYDSLTYKTRALLKWAMEQGYDYVFKCDDDTYAVPDRLLASGFDAWDYSGFRRPDYCCGAAYWVSQKAMEVIVTDNPQWPDNLEDRYVGRTLQEAGIIGQHDARYVPAYTMTGAVPPRKVNRIISTHKLNPQSMRVLHQNYLNS